MGDGEGLRKPLHHLFHVSVLHGKGIAMKRVEPRIKLRKVIRSRLGGRADEKDAAVAFNFEVCMGRVSAHGVLASKWLDVSGTVP